MRPFIQAHSDAWFELWSCRSEAIVGPDFAALLPTGSLDVVATMFFGFVAAWWPLRHTDRTCCSCTSPT